MAEKLKVNTTKFHDDEYVQLSDEFEQIRTCIGMYISYRGTKAAIHLFKEIFNNALDECVNTNSPADTVKVYFDEALGEIMILDNGRGIPFEVMKATITEKHTSTKFGRKFNVDSAGENGVGLKVTAALSDYFEATSYRGKESKTIIFRDGKMEEPPIKKEKKEQHGFLVRFRPSPKYLGEINMTKDDICDWLRCMSYICPKGITMQLYTMRKGSETCDKTEYTHEGLAADISYMAESMEIPPIELHTSQEGDNVENEMKLDVAFTYDKTTDNEVIDSFCNYVHTIENGEHVSGVESAICSFFVREGRKMDQNAKYEILYEDCKKGLILAVNCRTVKPDFGGQVKEKVTNPTIRTDARKLIVKELDNYFLDKQNVLKKIIDYLRKIARIRIEASGIKGIDVKKPSSWMDDAVIASYFPIADRNSKGYKELIIAEGVSAGGAILAVRNPEYQAVLEMKGVPFNAYTATLQRTLQNEVFRQLVKVLGCGVGADFNIAHLKWNRIIIMTDSDVDGFNITSLVCAFFVKHMPQIIEEERLYKSVPPLYSLARTAKNRKYTKKDFIFDKKEYFDLQNQIIADNVILQKVYEDDDGEIRYINLTKKESLEFLEKNQMYGYYLKNLHKKTACPTMVLEVICWELVQPEIVLEAKWEIPFKKKIEKDFPEMTFDTTTHSLSGSLHGDMVTVIVDSIFMKNAKKFINVLINNDNLYVRFTNKNEPESMIMCTIGDFLEATGQRYNVEIAQRFKGIGEVPEELLFRSTLNPALRKLIKVTMDDPLKADETFNILHGDSTSDERKKLIEGDWLTLEDLDN